jgi:hypothetical protein
LLATFFAAVPDFFFAVLLARVDLVVVAMGCNRGVHRGCQGHRWRGTGVIARQAAQPRPPESRPPVTFRTHHRVDAPPRHPHAPRGSMARRRPAQPSSENAIAADDVGRTELADHLHNRRHGQHTRQSRYEQGPPDHHAARHPTARRESATARAGSGQGRRAGPRPQQRRQRRDLMVEPRGAPAPLRSRVAGGAATDGGDHGCQIVTFSGNRLSGPKPAGAPPDAASASGTYSGS